ncbi:MAG: PocR ligand-binding domain-containing protein [Candidatus Kapaibacterium sp.]
MSAKVKLSVAEVERLKLENRILRQEIESLRSAPGISNIGGLMELFENKFPGIIWVVDTELRLVRAYGNGLRIFNIPTEEIPGKTLYDIIGPENSDIPLIVNHEKVLRGEHIEYESGQSGIFFQVQLEPLYDENENVIGVAGIAFDTSSLKQIEKQFYANEERFRSLYENLATGYQSLDVNGRFLEINSVWCETLGYERDEIIGKWFGDFLVPASRAKFVSAFPRFKEIGEVHNIHFEMIAGDGSIKNVVFNGKISYNPEGSFLRTHCLLQDITAKRKAEEALRASEERLRLVFEATNDAFWDFDPRSGEAYFSPRWYEMLGYEPYIFPQNYETWRSLLHPDDAEDTESKVQEAIRTGSDYAIEFRLMHKNGSPVWILAKGQIIEYDDAGRPTRMVGTHSDISRQKELENALRKRVLALTSPIGDLSDVDINHLFDMEDIQRLQDAFSHATGVASIVTRPDGTPLTRPSNFCRLCSEIIRNTEKGLENCKFSDSVIGRGGKDSAIVSNCLSGGLIDGGAGIYAGDKHVANWLIGQVIDKDFDEVKMLDYADEIGVDRKIFADAMNEVPRMSHSEFEKIAHALYLLATLLSNQAVQNIQQAREIVRRESAESELRSTRNYLDNILNSLPSSIIGVDKHLIITHHNNQSTALFNDSVAIGLHISEALPRFSDFIADIEKAIAGSRPLVREAIEFNLNNSRKFLDITISPLVNEGEGGAVLRIDDVTERVMMREIMIQTEKMMSVGGLAAGMAHEINNPLGVILQGIQNTTRRLMPNLTKNQAVAAECGIDLEKLEIYLERRNVFQYIGGIQDAGTRAARIVQNMLNFSRRSESKLAPTDINQLLDSSLELAQNDYDLKKKYDFKKIRIVRDFGDNMPKVPVTATEIEQVIFNLLKNAAQALSESETPIETPTIYIRTYHRNYNAIIEVEDNGPGMEIETRRRAFEPFFTTKGVSAGTGLGLSVSYFIIKNNHKGDIKLESRPGKGTKFVIEIPTSRRTTA